MQPFSNVSGELCRVRSRWISAPVGYLRLQVRGSDRLAADAGASAQILVHYALAWGG
jgi:hypothetical protein